MSNILIAVMIVVVVISMAAVINCVKMARDVDKNIDYIMDDIVQLYSRLNACEKSVRKAITQEGIDDIAKRNNDICEIAEQILKMNDDLMRENEEYKRAVHRYLFEKSNNDLKMHGKPMRRRKKA